MSSRRAARAGIDRRVARRDGLPVELSDRHHPVWKDAAATQQLLDDLGLAVSDRRRRRSLSELAWWARFDAVRDAWCRANGLMHPQWVDNIDNRQARRVGVDMSSSSRYRLRVLTDQGA